MGHWMIKFIKLILLIKFISWRLVPGYWLLVSGFWLRQSARCQKTVDRGQTTAFREQMTEIRYSLLDLPAMPRPLFGVLAALD
jgi:hypothetical protein